MFNEDYNAPKRETVPTLAQFLKTLPKNTKVLQQLFGVDIIWTPGKFDNFTLQTHAFRLIIPRTHSLYDTLVDAMGSDEGFNSIGAFGIRVLDRENGNFRLEQKKSKSQWQKLGQNGFKMPTDP